MLGPGSGIKLHNSKLYKDYFNRSFHDSSVIVRFVLYQFLAHGWTNYKLLTKTLALERVERRTK